LFVTLRDYIVAEKIDDGHYFFSSHPRMVERLENYERIAGDIEQEKQYEVDAFEKNYFCIRLRGVVLYCAEMSLAAGKFELVAGMLDRLLAVGDDAAALVMRGDMERKLSPRSAAPAEWYEKALESDPENVAALRALGFMYYSIGDKDKAGKYLLMYCAFAGDAADVKMAREVLLRCKD
jgi:tetratricopeptide (TPR) repeat protein